MDRHIQTLLNRLSFASMTIATVTLFFLLSQTPHSCISNSNPNPNPKKPQIKFPTSSCDVSARETISIDKKNKRIHSTIAWRFKVASFADFFLGIRTLGFLSNHSKVLCVSAGAGHEVMALSEIGVADVTGVEVVESPPLVSRADPHDLPFFDGAFDLGFSAHFEEALFPVRFAGELERTVRPGGVCVLAVEECGDVALKEIKELFGRSSFLEARNVTLSGLKMTRIIVKRNTGRLQGEIS